LDNVSPFFQLAQIHCNVLSLFHHGNTHGEYSYPSLLHHIIGSLALDANTITTHSSNENFANLDYLPSNGSIAGLVTKQTYLALNQTSLLFPLNSLLVDALPTKLFLNLILSIIIINTLSTASESSTSMKQT
jgi:hypothetical protein